MLKPITKIRKLHKRYNNIGPWWQSYKTVFLCQNKLERLFATSLSRSFYYLFIKAPAIEGALLYG
jgi:hypothetical protein